MLIIEWKNERTRRAGLLLHYNNGLPDSARKASLGKFKLACIKLLGNKPWPLYDDSPIDLNDPALDWKQIRAAAYTREIYDVPPATEE